MYPSDFRTSFSGLSPEGWEMELKWEGVEDSEAVLLAEASPSETHAEMELEVIGGGGAEKGMSALSPFPATPLWARH